MLQNEVKLPINVYATPKDYFRIYTKRFLKSKGLLKQTIYTKETETQYLIPGKDGADIVVPDDAEIAYLGENFSFNGNDNRNFVWDWKVADKDGKNAQKKI